MLDLNRIFGMREHMLPQVGFWGFLLKNWLVIAIAIMTFGFVIDQVLYVIRYRPQDSIMRLYQRVKGTILQLSGKEVAELTEDDEQQSPKMQTEAPLIYKADDQDVPVIRRGGARYMPPIHKEQTFAEEAHQNEMDADAPLVVRASSNYVRSKNGDPDTQRGKM